MKFLFLCVNDSDVIGIFEYGCESVRRPGAALSARDGRFSQYDKPLARFFRDRFGNSGQRARVKLYTVLQ